MKTHVAAALLAVILAVVILAIITPSDDAEGAATTFDNGDFQYSVLNDSSVTLLKYNGTDPVVNVPDKVSSYKVRHIAARAFENNGLTEIILPADITSIGSYAFRNCTNLENVVMGDAVSELGVGIFEGCSSLEQIRLSISLTSLTMEMFSGCTSLEEIAVPENVSTIETDCFKGCTSLRNINLENSSFRSNGFLMNPFTMGTDFCSINCGSSALNLTNLNSHTDDATIVKHNEKTFTLTIRDVLDDTLVSDPLLRQEITTGIQCGSALEIDNPPQMEGWIFKKWDIEPPTIMPAKDLVLTATWKVRLYTVTFCLDEEMSQVRTMQIPYNSVRNLEPNIFVNDHGVFCGWSTEPQGEVAYNDGELYHMDVPSDKILYAVWRADYFLSFDPNGGTGEMTSQPFLDGVGRLIKTNTFRLLGHVFTGWSDTPDGEVKYTDGSAISLHENLTLYAKWEQIKYNIVFNYDNGTQEIYVLENKLYGEPVTIPSLSPTLIGHYLIGWSLQMSGSGVYKAGDIVSQLPYSDTLEGYRVNLYAVWGNHILTVAYHNQAEGATKTQIFSYGTPLPNLNSNVFTRKYYAFDGWALSSDGPVEYMEGADITDRINQATDSDLTLHLYAKWSVNTYKVVYDPGDGDGHMDFPTIRNYDTYTIEDCAYTYEGHSFVEWRIIYSDGTFVTYHPGNEVVNLSDGNDVIVLNAIWKADGESLPLWVYVCAASAILAGLVVVAVIFRNRF